MLAQCTKAGLEQVNCTSCTVSHRANSGMLHHSALTSTDHYSLLHDRKMLQELPVQAASGHRA